MSDILYGCDECRTAEQRRELVIPSRLPYGTSDVDAAFGHALDTHHRVYIVARDRRIFPGDRRFSNLGGRRRTDGRGLLGHLDLITGTAQESVG
ncbi:MAG TPA: hypothetical protein VMH41_16955 [Mycobacteriales bacterium]|nr:hypothetical protein [Mycobacteriales bacterium]